MLGGVGTGNHWFAGRLVAHSSTNPDVFVGQEIIRQPAGPVAISVVFNAGAVVEKVVAAE